MTWLYVFNLSLCLLHEKLFEKGDIGDGDNGKENITVFQKEDAGT